VGWRKFKVIAKERLNEILMEADMLSDDAGMIPHAVQTINGLVNEVKEWHSVFGHLSLDADEAGNTINSRRDKEITLASQMYAMLEEIISLDTLILGEREKAIKKLIRKAKDIVEREFDREASKKAEGG
jgi:uncharacterized coiled-coil DUF342 family protein